MPDLVYHIHPSFRSSLILLFLCSNMSVEPAKRSDMRVALFQLEAIIERIHANEYIIKEGMNIDLQHMVLDMTSEHKPHFFEAYPSLPELNEEKRDELHECLDDEDTCYMRPIDRTYQLETALDRYTLDTLWDKFDEHLWTIKE